ncbi:hypothetical protein ABT279_44255, partial [Amycolatopsis sp. NPDC000673]
MSHATRAGSEANPVNGAEAQVIPLHGPGREKPAEAPEQAEERVDAPVVEFPAQPSGPVREPAADPLSESVRGALTF